MRVGEGGVRAEDHDGVGEAVCGWRWPGEGVKCVESWGMDELRFRGGVVVMLPSSGR